MSDTGYSGGPSRDNGDGGANNPNRGQGRCGARVAATGMRPTVPPTRGNIFKGIVSEFTGRPPPPPPPHSASN